MPDSTAAPRRDATTTPDLRRPEKRPYRDVDGTAARSMPPGAARTPDQGGGRQSAMPAFCRSDTQLTERA
ncbi:MAG: hypothetical protein L0H64_12005 [Pseudonocardia sp.]|nr:hypothetical protein [Pseudonocardia sp.]